MEITSALPEPIQWSEGMLLSPQHLQQNDIYWQERLRHALACVQPNYWGLIDLAINAAELVNGTLLVERLHCVMPDGLVVQHPRSGDKPLRLDLKALKWEAGKDRRIHVAVPLRTEGAASATSAIQRYGSVPGALEVDENTGEDRVEIGRMRPRIELRAADAVTAKYASFPLVEVRRGQNGAFALTAFHPPMLRVSASAFLGEERGLQGWLVSLTRQARERAQELSLESEGESAGEAARGERAAPDARRRQLAVHHATKSLPPFELLVRSPCTHPSDLYLGLAHLVGQVGAIGEDAVPPAMEPYRHDDCLPGFRAALEFVETRLEQLALAFEWLPFSDDVMPLLERRRLPGALHAPAQRHQMQGLTPRPGRALFALQNQEMEAGTSRVPMFRGGRPLWIQGPANSQAPLAISLYRARATHPGLYFKAAA
jgi:type VI secretion system protein ImpJ